jgi:DNA repair protein RadA/Sms
VLIGGDPGVGKSTLLLQAAHRVARETGPVLYVSAEESPAQIRHRAARLGVQAPRLFVAGGGSLSDAADDIARLSPSLVIADSIQTVSHPDVPSIPGSVTQVRECAARLNASAKAAGFALVLIGHVTKEGGVAGPRTLEHLVDAVLLFEGDRLQNYRLLRAAKNRFGPAGEIGLFEMGPSGLADVSNPSRWFLSRAENPAPGSVTTPALVGTRTLIVDVQALTLRSSFASPARRASGVDPNRLAVILAVLEKRAGLALSGDDVFVAPAGGARLDEPSSDLAVALAVASTFRNLRFPSDTAVLGEVGLGGEIRPCGPVEGRMEEAARLGFRRLLVPAPAPESRSALKVIPVRSVVDALGWLGNCNLAA